MYKLTSKINLENLKSGFEKYFLENGHYPSVAEVDACAYLPSSRQIQRIFKGGVKELRKILGIELTDLRTGMQRSRKVKEIGERGIRHEIIVQKILISKFGEMYVHEQKPFADYSGRFDFVVYCKQMKFGIDVFFANDKRSFTGCLNNKIRVYKNSPFLILLVHVNDKLSNEFDITNFIANKKNTLPSHIRLIDLEGLKEYIKTLEVIKS